MEPWTIKQLKQKMDEDLLYCETEIERASCQGIWKRAMVRFAATLTRKLTPGEQSILDSL